MGFAVELYFNPELEAALRRLRERLTRAGVTPTLDALGDRPHVSLAVFDDVDVARLTPELAAFAAQTPAFPVAFASVGAFPTAEGVVFLAPVMTETLMQVHRDFHRRLAALGIPCNPYYAPDAWVPHSTIAFEVSRPAMVKAVDTLLAEMRPLTGTCCEVGLAEFRPIVIRQLYPLSTDR